MHQGPAPTGCSAHRCNGESHGTESSNTSCGPNQRPDTSASSLLATLGLNLLIPTAQVIGGLHANSMALLSDAAHNFSDFTAVLIAYVANRIGRKGASVSNTFGYRRIEILAALVNGALLLAVSAFIVYEGFHRLRHPTSVLPQVVVLVAGIGVLGNGLSAWLLHRDAGHNLNVRGAFFHMLGDLLTSVMVVLNGIVLSFKPWYWLDPALSLIIAVFIVRNCWVILKEAASILMNATPSGLDILEVKSFLEAIPGVTGTHYMHAWNVSSSSVAFSCHLVVPDQRLSEVDGLSNHIRSLLLERFGIDHPVLQFETTPCGDAGVLCELSCGQASPRSSPPNQEGGSTRTVVLMTRLALGAIFVYASLDKILHPGAFAQTLYNYQILPNTLISVTAITLPWVELVTGLALIFGWWIPGATILANLLLLTFFGALAFNATRGMNVECGCFGSGETAEGHAWWYLLRDSGFLLLGFLLSWGVFKGGKSPKT